MTDDRTIENRVYMGTTSAYCRSCREQELFDRYQVTTTDIITQEKEHYVARKCQGCGYEQEEPNWL
jgi:predicted nucleic-acid-binding Zn-ribbon protein